jgi:hypothetical protein
MYCDVLPNLYPVSCRVLPFLEPVPKTAPLETRVSALHRLGLTPADEANSAGVWYPKDV